MALGDQSKALRIISLNKGWDPTKIEGTGESIANFDKAPEPWKSGDQSVGSLPQGTPDTFPDAQAPNLSESVPFNAPNTGPGWDSTSRASVNTDPFAGMGGQ